MFVYIYVLMHAGTYVSVYNDKNIDPDIETNLPFNPTRIWYVTM